MFGSVPRLYPVEADDTSLSQLLQPKCLQLLPNVPWGLRLLPGEDHWDRGIAKCKGPEQQQAKEA